MNKITEEKIRTFKDLRVWQKGVELVKEMYKATTSYPKTEEYGLSSQMRRASVSVPANIAEGFRRRSSKEHKQFINIALGSCAELETLVIISHELKYIDASQQNCLTELIDHICGMLVNLGKKL
ncbi:MAG: four helix bundle protein [Candidatus Omnitrophica bacterium]|nr:four helix bundle protein [Candidatus Omnitrophota bacterium]